MYNELTFRNRWDLNNVISQTHVLAKAVANVVERAISFSVGVGGHPIH